MAQSKWGKKKAKSRPIEPKLARLNRPEGLSLKDWQKSKRTYRVAIRENALGDILFSCPDFATNTLGSSKYNEFTYAKLPAPLSRPLTNGKATRWPPGSYFRRDERSGETYLRLHVPPPEFFDSLFALLKQFRGA